MPGDNCQIWCIRYQSLSHFYLCSGGEGVDVGVGCEYWLRLGAGAVACVEGCVGVVCGYVVEKLAWLVGCVWAVGEMQSADIGFYILDAGKSTTWVDDV